MILMISDGIGISLLIVFVTDAYVYQSGHLSTYSIPTLNFLQNINHPVPYLNLKGLNWKYENISTEMQTYPDSSPFHA